MRTFYYNGIILCIICSYPWPSAQDVGRTHAAIVCVYNTILIRSGCNLFGLFANKYRSAVPCTLCKCYKFTYRHILTKFPFLDHLREIKTSDVSTYPIIRNAHHRCRSNSVFIAVGASYEYTYKLQFSAKKITITKSIDCTTAGIIRVAYCSV